MSNSGNQDSTSPDPDSGFLVLDLEWSPPNQGDELLAVGWQDTEEDYRPHSTRPGNVPKRVWRTLRDGETPVFEFTKADAIQLLRRGLPFDNPIGDIQVAAWILNENQKLDLASLVKKHVGVVMDKRIVRVGNRVLFRCDNGKVVPIEQAPKHQLYAYNRRDVGDELSLTEVLLDKLDRRGFLEYFLEEEVPYTRVLVDMQLAGIPIDIDETIRLRDELEVVHADKATALLGGLPGVFNLGSDIQVGDYLFKRTVRIPGRIPVADAERIPDGFHPDPDRDPGRLWVWGEWVFPGLGLRRGALTDKCRFDECKHEDPKDHRPAVNKTALRMNPATRDHPWVEGYLEYQKVDTILTVFLRKFVEVYRLDDRGEPRIYCEFNQTGTRTGRLSSSNPNMQNIPTRGPVGKQIRGLFRVPDPALPFLMGDFSQLETRLMAHFSQDPYLLKIFREGRDPFIEMASDLYGRRISKEDDERAVTKNVWYAQGYGAMPDKMFEMVTMEGLKTSLNEIEGVYDDMQELLVVYFDWREELIESAHARGYVETIGGRRRRIQFSKSTSWKETSHGERAAANAKVQGSAADIVRRTMLRFSVSYLRLLLQVHDELVYRYLMRKSKQVRERDVRALNDVATVGHGYDLSVPLVFDAKIALSWAEKG